MFPDMAQCPLGGRTPLFDSWGRHTQKQGAEEGELVRPPLVAGGPALWSAPALPRPGAGTGALARPGRRALGIGPERAAHAPGGAVACLVAAESASVSLPSP